MREKHLLSFDCEEYFQSEAPPHDWERLPPRIEWSTNHVLDLLDEFNARATFFVVGWIADRYPGLVRTIADRGHELACHSYQHKLVFAMTPREFQEDTRRARASIEQAAGRQVLGYRAPSFSITPATGWAIDMLVEEGFSYDSSVFPIYHDVYGWPGAPRYPHRIRVEGAGLWEFPPATLRLFWRIVLPVAGGGYLRLLPAVYTRWGLRLAAAERSPLLIYIHPWEFDPGQPRLPGRFSYRIRHYSRLRSVEEKARELLATYSFIGIGEYLAGNAHGEREEGAGE